MPTRPIDRVLARLGDGVRRNGSGHVARCPAHDDRNPSLSIDEGDDGRVLLRCHAGCAQEAVVSALGLAMHDLFASSSNGSGPHVSTDEPRTVDEAIVEAQHAVLLARADKLDWLREQRGLTVETIRRHQIGYEDATGRYCIPIRDEQGVVRNIRRYKPHADAADKVISWRQGFGAARLWPFDSIARAQAENLPLYIMEGELDCLLALQHGLCAVTSTGGAGTWRREWGALFTGRDVRICYDCDDAGRAGAADVAAKLHAHAASVRLINLPLDADGADFTDYIVAHEHTIDEFRALPLAEPSIDATAEVPRPTQQTLLLDIVRERTVLWHDAEQNAYASVRVNGHHANMAVRSRAFARWLKREYYERHARAPGTTPFQEALGVIEGIAIYDGCEHTPYLRVAEHEGRSYIALNNEPCSIVEVHGDGWRTVADAPVRFVHASGQTALLAPQRGGSIDLLRPFVNGSDETFMLVVAWLLGALRGAGPYPILCIGGEQGSAKSTLTRLLASLVDAHATVLRSLPREERALGVAARNAWVLAFDNASHVQPWLSDALCRLATGGGITERALYTDDEEVSFSGMRPIIINGIGDLLTRPDLRERALFITLDPIPDSARRTEAQVMAEFDAVRPLILGALCDGIAAAIRKLPTTTLPSLPRMADFALWVTAAEEGLGWESGTFMRAYTDNRNDAAGAALDTDLVAGALIELGSFVGTASELLQRLTELVREEQRGRYSGWPTSPEGLARRLDRLAPELRRAGVRFTRMRHGTGGARRRVIRIERDGELPEEPNF